MGADNDAHYAECHSFHLEVGISDEVAYPKIVSRLRVNQSRRSIHHSNRLGKLRNFSPRHKLLSSMLGKRRAKVSEKSVFLENFSLVSKSSLHHMKEREISHKIKVFREK